MKLTFVTQALRRVVLLDNPVDVAHRRADEQSKDERNSVVAIAPDVDIDGIKDQKRWEAP